MLFLTNFYSNAGLRNTIFFSILIFSLISCKDNKEEKALSSAPLIVVEMDTLKSNDENLVLEYFDELPKEVDGCGDYYQYDTSKNEDRLMFVSNLTDGAFIKINGKTIVLTIDTSLSKEIDSTTIKSVFKNSKYTITKLVSMKERYDEGGLYIGTLTIEFNDKKYVIKIKGTTGC